MTSYLDPALLANIRGGGAAQGGGQGGGWSGSGGNFLGPLMGGLGSGIGGVSEAIGNHDIDMQSLLSGPLRNLADQQRQAQQDWLAEQRQNWEQAEAARKAQMDAYGQQLQSQLAALMAQYGQGQGQAGGGAPGGAGGLPGMPGGGAGIPGLPMGGSGGLPGLPMGGGGVLPGGLGGMNGMSGLGGAFRGSTSLPGFGVPGGAGGIPVAGQPMAVPNGTGGLQAVGRSGGASNVWPTGGSSMGGVSSMPSMPMPKPGGKQVSSGGSSWVFDPNTFQAGGGVSVSGGKVASKQAPGQPYVPLATASPAPRPPSTNTSGFVPLQTSLPKQPTAAPTAQFKAAPSVAAAPKAAPAPAPVRAVAPNSGLAASAAFNPALQKKKIV